MVGIKNFKPRLYQETILATAVEKNTLVVLPTGMGKTAISMMLAVQRLKNYPQSKILVLAPTKPLVEQHLNTFKKHMEIEEEKLVLFTGMIKPEKRAELWKDAKIIFSTPQGLENDLISGRIGLEEVSLLTVDECHRSVKEYSYVFVAEQYNKKARFPRILALTASPGSELEKIEEVVKTLFIEGIEIRTDDDLDVKPYVQEVDIKFVNVGLPPVFLDIKKYFESGLKERLKKLKDIGILQRKVISYVSKTDVLRLQAEIQGRIARGEKNFVLWQGASITAEIMKLQHGLELLETQGISALHAYLNRLMEDSRKTKTKAIQNIVKDINFRSALIKTEKLYEEKIEHPKLIELQKMIEKEVKDKQDVKIMVFNQYRDNALDIKNKLNAIENVRAEIFVGQLKKGETGLSQKEQKEVLERFRNGLLNVIVATSIGEEGLDIPKVDLVIFYEPIPSAIRQIQRRGRTGRQEKGRVFILIASNTRDEGYRWSAHHKEKRMYRNLEKLKNKLSYKKQSDLKTYVKEKPGLKIFADIREKGNGAIKELVNNNFEVVLQRLDTGDYILSSRVGVELKKTEDFVNSIIDGRLLPQIKELKRSFERPLLIIEGDTDIYSVRNIHPNAIRGMLAAITVDYGVPILYSRNPQETAAILQIIAKREQEETPRDFAMHSVKPMSLKELQEYIVASLPGVGTTLSKPLLKKFKTIKKIANAKEEQLKKVEKIGDEKARKIREVLDKEYDG